MTRNHYIGGAVPAAKDLPPKTRQPKPVTALIPCTCGGRTTIALIPGSNDVTFVCAGCGSLVNVLVRYDGFGLVMMIKGSTEVVE